MENMDIANKKLTREQWDKKRSEFKDSLSKDYGLSESQVHVVMKNTATKQDWESDLEGFKDEHFTENGVKISNKEVSQLLGELAEEGEKTQRVENMIDEPGDEIKPIGWQLEDQVKGRVKHQEFEDISANASFYVASYGGHDKDVENEIKKDLNKLIDERGLDGPPVVSKEAYDKQKELAENGQTEVAKPGRTYTGNIIDVGEDVTIQKTKTGKFIIHETENLPGIKESDETSFSQIRYNKGGKGDILQKANDLEIGKQKELEKQRENELNF